MAAVLYQPYLLWLPRGIHEWAQADRLAIALSFYDYGFDFWHPRTFSLESTDGITGVEFPLVSYVAALLGGVFGRTAISPIFRLLTISSTVMGCWYLFRCVFDYTRQFIVALLPGAFLLASPTFVYYSGNYLADPVSASLAIIGLYYVQRFYYQEREFRDILMGLGLLSVATLLKLSAGLYLIGVLLLLWLAVIVQKQFTRRERLMLLVASILSSGALVGYTLYSRYLNNAYHSVLFLAVPRPIIGSGNRSYIWSRIREVWWPEYLSWLAADVLKAAVLTLLWYVVSRSRWRQHRIALVFLALLLVGGRAFYELMGQQFIDHDYYAIAPYAPLAALLVASAAILLGQRPERCLVIGLSTVVVAGLLIVGAGRNRQRMREPYGDFSNYYMYHWMVDGAKVLANAQVPASAQVLVLGEPASNLALVYLDRRGITWQTDVVTVPENEIVDRMKTHQLSYLVMSEAHWQQFKPSHSELVQRTSTTMHTPNFIMLQLLDKEQGK
ncbi:hypothetical protein J4D97_21475 [Hymenobacter defluvii]|uniref:Glycosyltransferase RgtA/B/C/D-like domain-containing protein n=2 Tax=Hymenobacter defluvii TaxID=2054411 RepID=A0ABS3THV4_9BACT|nr:hypothetical protein [Hymenobacter defluvii]